MKSTSKQLIYWAPRSLSVLFAMFIGIFSLDVFGEHLPFCRLVLALFMHLVPTFVVLVVLALAWKWEWVGGIGYVALGLLYLYMFGGRFPWFTYALIAGPAFLIGTLFVLSWMFRDKLHPHS